MRRTYTIIALMWLAASGSGPTWGKDACAVARAPMDAVIRLPFSVVDGRVYVEARVNGRGPYRFAVDTGASGMGRLDASMLATLGLHPSDRAATSDAVKTVEVETTHLDSLSLGSLERKDLDVITRDYKKQATGDAAFDGILGRAFFSDGLLVIDYGRRQITFSTASRLSRDDSDALSYERAFRVPVRINGKLFEANIDTGANVSMVVPSHMWSGISSAPLERSGTGQLSNTKIETSQGVVAGSVELSAVVLKDVDAKVSDRFPEILIGAHLMASSILAIDQRSNTIAVCPI